MKKVKLIIAATALLSLVSGSAVYAGSFAAGEGLYVGVFGGAGMGIVQPKVTTEGRAHATGDRGAAYGNPAGTFEAQDGGIGLEGLEGGGWVGYGYKMGDLYAGIEGEIAGGDVTFKLTSDIDVVLSQETQSTGTAEVSIKEVEATKEWTGGMFGRVGYYVNADTLLAFRAGALVSKFDVKTTGSTNYSEDFYGGGPSFGVSLESKLSAVDPNLSVRMGAVYTDFLTASVFGIGDDTGGISKSGDSGSDNEVTGSALSARIGLTYSFLDVNSLF